MKADTYYMVDGNKINRSKSFERLLNLSLKASNAVIFYNGNIIWEQNPSKKATKGP